MFYELFLYKIWIEFYFDKYLINNQRLIDVFFGEDKFIVVYDGYMLEGVDFLEFFLFVFFCVLF